jgi:hypothetical protein
MYIEYTISLLVITRINLSPFTKKCEVVSGLLESSDLLFNYYYKTPNNNNNKMLTIKYTDFPLSSGLNTTSGPARFPSY